MVQRNQRTLNIIIGDYWLVIYYGNLKVRSDKRKVRSHYKVR